MPEITLEAVLAAREERVRLQKELILKYRCPLISFTMNIAGPVKISPLIRRGFLYGVERLDESLPCDKVRNRRIDFFDTGCQAIYSVDSDSNYLKDICTKIEEESPLGRLFDMDVINSDGKKLERGVLRGCLVCGAPGRDCASRRVHSVEELQTVTARIIIDHFMELDSKTVSSLAVESLIKEVYTTPKPGLVDKNNSGSHRDMNLDTFVNSAHALVEYFKKCVTIGQSSASYTPHETFLLLQKEGISAEETMYKATGGVNTHKGVIYSMGVLCGAIGRLWSACEPFADISAILSESASVVSESVKLDFENMRGKTAGERAYLSAGIMGIRGEAASGFSTVSKLSLPIFEKGIARGLDENHAGVVTLVHLISHVKDTNLYNRGGKEGAEYAARRAMELLSENEFPTLEQVETMDNDFIVRYLSPGGCADLLAITYFLSGINKIKI